MSEGGPSTPKQKPSTLNDKLMDFGKNITAGGVSASVAKTINSPLEVAKLIRQTQPERFSGLTQLLIQLPRQEGIKALWAGNFTNVMRYFPTQALNFAFKDLYKDMLMPRGEKFGPYSTMFRSMAAGGAAGASSMFFVYPLDLARTLLSTDKKSKDGKKKYQGLGHVLKLTYADHGFVGLYKGFAISVAGIIPYRAVYFGGYDTLKALFLGKDSNFFEKWLVAQTNTIIAQFITYPIDTIRRTLMKAGEKDHNGVASRKFKNSWECFVWILKERGVKGIYGGSLANTWRATGAALCMVFYDTITEKFF
jgi:solute carrier family 25 (adenine nucleotide translocator) protein 4/5/6/31